MARRLAAIVAADVVGYSRLMAADEAGTHARLKALRKDFIEPKVAAHHGRIVKLMGDGVLVEFASVVDAVECAAAIQEGVAELQAGAPEDQRIALRIGINIGDIIIEDDDIYGDGVNVAARLEALAEPGGICVSRTVYNHVKTKVAFGFEPLGEHRVKNIPEPITAYRVLPEPGPVTKTLGLKRASGLRGRWLASAGAFVLLLGAATAALWLRPWAPGAEVAVLQGAALPLPDEPSIAVLPFDNLSDDPEQEYFADGMTEDLITDLSKIGSLFVIARNSTFSYKARPVNVQQVAEDLGVRYVLEGSVRHVGRQVRINAQLIDATSGGHLWAERYDGSLQDIFGLQDRVTRAIAAALSIELTAGEAQQVGRGDSANPEAYKVFLKGRHHYNRQSPEDFRQAIAHFERALTLDPTYGRAYAALAATYWQAWKRYWVAHLGLHRVHDARIEAETLLAKAMKQPTALAYQVRAEIRAQLGRYEDAIGDAERAISLDPNDADGYVALAGALSLGGRPAEALDRVERGMRLNPYYPAHYLYQLGLAQFCLGRLADAAESLERAHTLTPDDRWSTRMLIAVYGLLGRYEEAIDLRDGAIASYQGMDPLTITSASYWYPFADQEHAERFAEGLRRADVPK